MSYPTYRQDFEGGTTLATACPELVDVEGTCSIDSSGSKALTGTRSLALSNTGTHNVFSNANETLGGNLTLSVYFLPGSTSAFADSIFVRNAPLSNLGTNYLRANFTTGGLQLSQDNAGTVVTLNAAISGAALVAGIWYCLELRASGANVTSRLVRQDNGQFFVHSGSGSWSSTPQGVSGTATGAIATASAGGWGFRGSDSVSLYLDTWTIEPAVPVLDSPTFTLVGIGSTRQLTAGGFTDPVYGVTWGSSNTAVATVNSAGLVTAVAGGTATITATGRRDTGQTATAAVTVTATTAFKPHPNNVTSTLASGYTAGSGSLVLAAGTGAQFGSSFPLLVTVATAASYNSPAEVQAVYTVTGRTSDTLTGVTVAEGTTDRNFSAGDRVDVRWTSGLATAIEAAVNNLESQVIFAGGSYANPSWITSLDGGKITTGTVAAARLGSGTPSAGNWLRGDGAWSPLWTVTSITGSGSITANSPNWYSVDATSGAVTLTLPTASAVGGIEYLITKRDSSANAVTIQRSGTDTFVGGATSMSLSAIGKYCRLVSGGGFLWFVVGSN